MIRLQEALDFARMNGRKVLKKELASLLWRESQEHTQMTNLGNMLRGSTKKIDIDAVPLICEKLGVTADFLFGMSEKPQDSGCRDKIEYLENQISKLKSTI